MLPTALLLVACGVAQPVHVKPTVDECQQALVQIDVDEANVIAAINSLKLDDQAGPKRHTTEWWDAKLSLLRSVASLASTVGRR